MVGVRFCRPIKPFKKGYKCMMTHIEKKSFPNRGPHDWYPLLIASEIPATIPTMLMMIRVVGGISSVVHLNAYSSPNTSFSSVALDVTVKLVSIPAITFNKPWNSAKKWAETPPMTQNCSFLHHSSMPTPLHRISRIPVAEMERKRAMNQRLLKLLIWKRGKPKRTRS